jgi:hypothetical protein
MDGVELLAKEDWEEFCRHPESKSNIGKEIR